MRPRWRGGPASITLVRQGESVGNLADTRAQEAQAEVPDLDDRDADVALLPRGREQAGALAVWLDDAEAAGSRPDAVISSPYRRAAETAERALARTRYPDEAERRSRLGKFYYQPPSGESWCDVLLRMRSLLRDVESLDSARLWLVTHQAVIMSVRLVLEELTELALLDIDRTTQLPNASLTVYERVDDTFVLQGYGDATLVEHLAAPVTRERDPLQRTGEAAP